MPSFVLIPADIEKPLSITGALGSVQMAKVIGAQYIERVRISETLAMAVDDSGAILRRPVNERASILYGSRWHGNYICGDAILGVEDFVGFRAGAGIDWVQPINPQALLIRVAGLIAERSKVSEATG
jgi:hypothetical protein